MRTWRLASLLSLGTLLLIAMPAAAGGWASATLTDPPDEPVAGQETAIGVDVRQHGVTPISWVRLRFSATNAATGEAVQAEGRPQGRTGHYVVKVTFPSEGPWDWNVRTMELQMDDGEFPAIVVAPATAGQPANAQAASVVGQAGTGVPGVDAVLVVGIGFVTLLIGTLAWMALRRRAAARPLGRKVPVGPASP